MAETPTANNETPEQQAPQEQSGASSPSEISESEKIRQRLIYYIGQGKDLRDKAVKVEVCHLVEADLQVPYGNVTKQVEKALKMAAKNDGKPEEVSKEIGGARVNVRLPKDKQEQAEEQAADKTEAKEQPKLEPKKPKLSDIYAAAKDEAALRETLEYKWLRKQVDLGVQFIDGMYSKFGLIEPGKSILTPQDPKAPTIDMADLTAQMCMKYDWSVPDKLEKVVFFGAWATMLVLPPLVKFGVIDDIKNGTFGKKKKTDNKSSEPLTKTDTKV